VGVELELDYWQVKVWVFRGGNFRCCSSQANREDGEDWGEEEVVVSGSIVGLKSS